MLLLQDSAPKDVRRQALDVIVAIGYLTLPIVYAATYLKKSLSRIDKYPTKLAKQRQKLLNYPKG